jgi:hypothetical protein
LPFFRGAALACARALLTRAATHLHLQGGDDGGEPSSGAPGDEEAASGEPPAGWLADSSLLQRLSAAKSTPEVLAALGDAAAASGRSPRDGAPLLSPTECEAVLEALVALQRNALAIEVYEARLYCAPAPAPRLLQRQQRCDARLARARSLRALNARLTPPTLTLVCAGDARRQRRRDALAKLALAAVQRGQRRGAGACARARASHPGGAVHHRRAALARRGGRLRRQLCLALDIVWHGCALPALHRQRSCWSQQQQRRRQ